MMSYNVLTIKYDSHLLDVTNNTVDSYLFIPIMNPLLILDRSNQYNISTSNNDDSSQHNILFPMILEINIIVFDP